MKKCLLSAVFVVLALFSTNPAEAHVVETNGSVGAVLHIDPDDDPIAGEESVFFFDIKDKTGRFNEKNCKCRLIIEQGKTMIHDELFNRSSGGTYTFPTRGIYSVKAVGEPIKTGAFDSFSLNYTIRVERGAEGTAKDSRNSTTLPLLLLLFLGTLFLFGVIRYKIVHKIK